MFISILSLFPTFHREPPLFSTMVVHNFQYLLCCIIPMYTHLLHSTQMLDWMACFAVILPISLLHCLPFCPHSLPNLLNMFVLEIISASALCKWWSLLKFSILIDGVPGMNFLSVMEFGRIQFSSIFLSSLLDWRCLGLLYKKRRLWFSTLVHSMVILMLKLLGRRPARTSPVLFSARDQFYSFIEACFLVQRLNLYLVWTFWSLGLASRRRLSGEEYGFQP